MKLSIRRNRPGLAVKLPQNLPIDLPETLSLTVPEEVSEGIASAVSNVSSAVSEVSLPAVSLPRSLESVQIPHDLPAKVAERLPSLPRGIRLPRFGRVPTSLSELEARLHIREREIRALQVQADRNLKIGLAVGTVAGIAVVLALLPDREARIAELRARLGGLDAPAEYVEDARRLAARARESLAERVRVAKEEARQVQEETKRELWARFEVAKRDGHQPPAV